MTFGQRLKELRGERSMGQIARALGITTVYYSDVESGRRPPFLIDAARLAEVLGGDVVDLATLAAVERGEVTIKILPGEPDYQTFVVRLARMLEARSLTDGQIAEIERVIGAVRSCVT